MRTFGAFRAATGAGAPSYFELHDGPNGPIGPDGTDDAPRLQPLRHAPWLGIQPQGDRQPFPDNPLAGIPVSPSKIIAVGRNYHAHAAERGADVPTSPLTWLKAPSSLLAHLGTVELPYPQHKVDFEAELGIVIGKCAKNVSLEEADEFIFGYTTCQDISDRNIQDSEKQFARAKSFDTFTPVGPYIYTDVGADDMAITLHQNGELRQNGRTGEMIFGVREIVSFCSQGTTLLPGDLILTGTPAGVGPIEAGDILETRIGPFAPLVVHVRNARP